MLDIIELTLKDMAKTKRKIDSGELSVNDNVKQIINDNFKSILNIAKIHNKDAYNAYSKIFTDNI